jgi:hypothetical protein
MSPLKLQIMSFFSDLASSQILIFGVSILYTLLRTDEHEGDTDEDEREVGQAVSEEGESP